jgi:uncharacterized coiled-coil DUF342 family protein
MDVLTSDVVGLGLEDEPQCVVRLAHYLGVERHRGAVKLHCEVRRNSRELRRRLGRSRRKLDAAVERFAEARSELDSKNDGRDQAPLHAMSEALRLSQELAAVRHLGRDNLHPYRLEVKRLRYILEMAEGDDRQQHALIGELKKVQDLIGEWHDWVQLNGIARKVLKQHKGCKLLRKIDATARTKFEEALRATERMRREYLQAAGKAQRRGSPKRSFASGPVLVAASEIAA